MEPLNDNEAIGEEISAEDAEAAARAARWAETFERRENTREVK